MQNLLSNTLLPDDLVEKTDFDLGLGFDNLQLNYDSNSTEPLSNQLTVVSLEDPVLEQPEFLENFLLSDAKESDDSVFKKPSNDFLSANGFKNKKKSDLSTTSGQSSETCKAKRSFKRSKMVNKSNQEIILSKNAPVGKHLKNRNTINASSFSNQNFFKYTPSKNLKPNKKTHKISSSIESSDASQTSLKSDKDPFPINNQSGMLKRDEFHLRIKELSLSDLHSSEDDSYNQDLNNKNKKFIF